MVRQDAPTWLKERISATPALLDGRVYLRTDKHLYAFGSRPSDPPADDAK